MAHALVVIHNEDERQRALRFIQAAPIGTRLDIKGPIRTMPQNSRMWAMLTDISEQMGANGRKGKTDFWKRLFLDQLRHEQEIEQEVVPSLYGDRMLIVGDDSSSNLTIPEMTDLIELMFKFGAENDIKWSDPNQWKQYR